MLAEKKDDEHAIQNARGWLETMVELKAAWEKLEEGEDSATVDGEEFTSTDDLSDRIHEQPLEVSVRSGWYNPGGDSEPEEFLILLSTGGPALRITGNLDRLVPGEDCDIEYQDWGTPWTALGLTSEEQEAVDWYAGHFYFGE